MRMKFTPAQSKIILQLSLSPLAWVGSHQWTLGACVILPKTGGLYGFSIQDKTVAVLKRRGVLKHGRLTEEQLDEFRRWATAEHRKLAPPTHGYLFKGFQENE